MVKNYFVNIFWIEQIKKCAVSQVNETKSGTPISLYIVLTKPLSLTYSMDDFSLSKQGSDHNLAPFLYSPGM